MNLSVGQVIFLLTKKSSKVYPVLVCEEIKKKSLSGETVNYVVRLPTEEASEVEIDKLDAEIFDTVESARETIIDRISRDVDKMLDSAVSLSSIFSNDAVFEESVLEEKDELKEQDDPSNKDFALVDLGDGNVARINVKDANQLIGD